MIDKRILLITTGGTIAGKVAFSVIQGELTKKSEEFLAILSSVRDSIKCSREIDIVLNHYELCEIDSSDMLPQQWIDLAQKIYNEYDNFDAFIITHGTNTMGYTAAALSFSLKNLDKPVIITGSQVPAGMPGSDAIVNLENAIRVAVLQTAFENQIKGVVAVFGSHIISGTRVKKSTEFDYDCFKSYGVGSIGRIGRMIDIDETNLKKHLGFLRTNKYNPAKKQKFLICENEFDLRIASLTEFPGMDVTIFKELIFRNEIKGFIIRAFGAGDPSTRLLPILRELKRDRIPVVITTQAPNGNSNFQVNEPGKLIADEDLAIPAYDMSIEAITTKFAWLLAKMKNGELSYKSLCNEMIENLKGEVNVILEVKM